jgi:hypothetical protein
MHLLPAFAGFALLAIGLALSYPFLGRAPIDSQP